MNYTMPLSYSNVVWSNLTTEDPKLSLQEIAILKSRVAITAALCNRDTMLLCDPPIDGWKYHKVDDKLKEALRAINAALAEKDNL